MTTTLIWPGIGKLRLDLLCDILGQKEDGVVVHLLAAHDDPDLPARLDGVRFSTPEKLDAMRSNSSSLLM